ncbi:HNH endonuclease [Nostoc sp.]
MNTFPTMRRLIKTWLKSGVMDDGQFFETNEGTPQGGVISPILANITLHGMEQLVIDYARSLKGNKDNNQKLSRWANRRHPGKSGKWISNKYWNTVGGNNWVFSVTKDGEVAETLISHVSKKIVRHIKVKGTASPFDGNLKYWSSRRGEHPLVPTRVAKLLKEQQGKCAHCGLYFREDDLIEVDHIIPKSEGGKDRYDNLQALHRHCHDSKTASDNRDSRLRGSTPADEEWLAAW